MIFDLRCTRDGREVGTFAGVWDLRHGNEVDRDPPRFYAKGLRNRFYEHSTQVRFAKTYNATRGGKLAALEPSQG